MKIVYSFLAINIAMENEHVQTYVLYMYTYIHTYIHIYICIIYIDISQWQSMVVNGSQWLKAELMPS